MEFYLSNESTDICEEITESPTVNTLKMSQSRTNPLILNKGRMKNEILYSDCSEWDDWNSEEIVNGALIAPRNNNTVIIKDIRAIKSVSENIKTHQYIKNKIATVKGMVKNNKNFESGEIMKWLWTSPQ